MTPPRGQTKSPRYFYKEDKFRPKIMCFNKKNFIDLALIIHELEPLQIENVKPSSGPTVCPIFLDQDFLKSTLLGLNFKTNIKLLSIMV